MFDPKFVADLIKVHYPGFEKLIKIEKILNERFFRLEDAIRALVLAVASGEPLLLIGPPGTGKSRLIRAFCHLIGLLDDIDNPGDHPDYFEYLLTPFTEPGELFGFYDIRSLTGQNPELQRLGKGMMMQYAKVVYLDEVFNGSSAILNSLLTFLNERRFHDRGESTKVAMQSLFAATNHIPETPELQAVFDRFTLRCRVENVPIRTETLTSLIEKGFLETYGNWSGAKNNLEQLAGVLGNMEKFREDIKKNKIFSSSPNSMKFHSILAAIVKIARELDYSEMSNRRLVKMAHVMLTHRVYEAICQKEFQRDNLELGADQLKLATYFFDRLDPEIENRIEYAVDIEYDN